MVLEMATLGQKMDLLLRDILQRQRVRRKTEHVLQNVVVYVRMSL
jgi:hypothetical protein